MLQAKVLRQKILNKKDRNMLPGIRRHPRPRCRGCDAWSQRPHGTQHSSAVTWIREKKRMKNTKNHRRDTRRSTSHPAGNRALVCFLTLACGIRIPQFGLGQVQGSWTLLQAHHSKHTKQAEVSIEQARGRQLGLQSYVRSCKRKNAKFCKKILLILSTK